MAGIIQKIGDALHGGGQHKEEDKHKAEHHGHVGEHKSGEQYKTGHQGAEHHGEHKEGVIEKIKDKIHGDGHQSKDGDKKKKKKEKKKHGAFEGVSPLVKAI
ncbi:protein SRC1 [Morus notabilis]|uniref:protein SRC1 n=1 Tax=Morus notabilis TaxID=981085 RepID=UPI000CED0594|nr:protein SRC1 [Morus notabilis]